MNWHKNIRKIQVDLTSYCNARCPGCHRNVDGGAKKDFLSLNHFDVDIWNRLVQQDLKDVKLESLALNGNWGDCGMHPDLPSMMETFINHHPKTSIFIATNGGMQSVQWWKQLGNVLSKSAIHKVWFALDGLADTNHIYRRNVKYDKVIQNIEGFVKGNGFANIIFTVFDHNIHQIDDVIKLAKDLGCFSIKIRKSFKEKMNVKTDTEDYVVTSDYNKDQIEIILNDFDPISNNKPYILTELQSTNCPWYNEGEVQIDPWGNVWPCCHISCSRFEDSPEINIIKEMGFNNFNLHHASLKEILDSTYYNKTLSDAVKCGTWEVCRQSCDIQIDK